MYVLAAVSLTWPGHGASWGFGWPPWTARRRDGARKLVDLIEIDLHQSWTDPITGESSLADVAAQRA